VNNTKFSLSSTRRRRWLHLLCLVTLASRNPDGCFGSKSTTVAILRLHVQKAGRISIRERATIVADLLKRHDGVELRSSKRSRKKTPTQ
jgi:hypothetical protein